MTAYVFIGPTLRREEVERILPQAICLPPVSQGDVYRAGARGPRAIGIIDGYFSGAPSVWHKEILWALSQGVHVFGSASMGALRAAELHTFGMRGVGRIFEAFRDAELEDDDEVAVVHGPPETGFLAASEPMVNMRATLKRAAGEAAISAETRSRLEALAKSRFFPHRTWPAVLKAAADGDLPEAELSRLRDWLPEGAVDQKREDALEMLAAMRSLLEGGEPCRVGFHFEGTHFWNDLVERAVLEQQETAASAGERGRVIDELRLLGPEAYQDAARNALLRMLAAYQVRRVPAISADARAAASARLRTALGLFSSAQLRSWMSQNELDEASYERLMEAEAGLHAAAENNRAMLESFLLDELRLSGRYQGLSARARDKAERLATHRNAGPGSATGPNAAQLCIWFFESRLGQPMPDDLQFFASTLGFTNADDFERALRDEFVYTRITGEDSGERR